MGLIIIGVVIVLFAMIANGYMAEVEDNSPGGFNNPDGKWIDVIKKPKPHQIIIWLLGLCTILWLIYMYITR